MIGDDDYERRKRSKNNEASFTHYEWIVKRVQFSAYPSGTIAVDAICLHLCRFFRSHANREKSLDSKNTASRAMLLRGTGAYMAQRDFASAATSIRSKKTGKRFALQKKTERADRARVAASFIRFAGTERTRRSTTREHTKL